LEALVAKNSKGKEASSENAAALVIAMSRGIFDSKVVELLVQLGEVLV
jgi:HD-GYP domain-containing protein (c-di-GMP phosphodiesterase class II)